MLSSEDVTAQRFKIGDDSYVVLGYENENEYFLICCTAPVTARPIAVRGGLKEIQEAISAEVARGYRVVNADLANHARDVDAVDKALERALHAVGAIGNEYRSAFARVCASLPPRMSNGMRADDTWVLTAREKLRETAAARRALIEKLATVEEKLSEHESSIEQLREAHATLTNQLAEEYNRANN